MNQKNLHRFIAARHNALLQKLAHEQKRLATPDTEYIRDLNKQNEIIICESLLTTLEVSVIF